MRSRTLLPISDGQVRLPDYMIGGGGGGGGSQGPEYNYNPQTGLFSAIPWNTFTWTAIAVNIQGTHSNAVITSNNNGGVFSCSAADNGTVIGSNGSYGVSMVGDIYYAYKLNQTITYHLIAEFANGTGGSIWGNQIDTYVAGVLVDAHFTQSTESYNLPITLTYTGSPIHIQIGVIATVYCEPPNNHYSRISGYLTS